MVLIIIIKVCLVQLLKYLKILTLQFSLLTKNNQVYKIISVFVVCLVSLLLNETLIDFCGS